MSALIVIISGDRLECQIFDELKRFLIRYRWIRSDFFQRDLAQVVSSSC
jgi:hypothetical protein